MKISCPFAAGKRYRVLRAFGLPSQTANIGEVVRFESIMEVVSDDEPPDEWLMFYFTNESQAPRVWEPQEGETPESWREYFEELL